MRRSDLYSGSDKISIESEALHMDLRSENAFENVLHAHELQRCFPTSLKMSSPTPPLYLVFCYVAALSTWCSINLHNFIQKFWSDTFIFWTKVQLTNWNAARTWQPELRGLEMISLLSRNLGLRGACAVSSGQAVTVVTAPRAPIGCHSRHRAWALQHGSCNYQE